VARWAVFAGVTALVLTLLLALARVSQLSMSDATTDAARPDSHDGPDGVASDAPDGEPRSSDFGPERANHTPETTTQSTSVSTGLLLANVALSQGLFLLILLGGAWYARIPLAALGVTTPGLRALAGGLVLGTGLYLANELGSLGAEAVGIETPDQLRDSLAPDSRVGWLVLLCVVLPTIALFEEFLFRAALIGALSAGFSVSPWLLAVLSSVAFALGHGAQGAIGMVVTGGLGFVLAGAFVVTGSLLVVVVAHYLINALEFIVHEGFDVDLSR
jgi:membrane protease YdiL (CAAX protease family)